MPTAPAPPTSAAAPAVCSSPPLLPASVPTAHLSASPEIEAFFSLPPKLVLHKLAMAQALPKHNEPRHVYQRRQRRRSTPFHLTWRCQSGSLLPLPLASLPTAHTFNRPPHLLFARGACTAPAFTFAALNWTHPLSRDRVQFHYFCLPHPAQASQIDGFTLHSFPPHADTHSHSLYLSPSPSSLELYISVAHHGL